MNDYDGDIYAGTDRSDSAFWDNADDLRDTFDWTRCPVCGTVDDFAISTDERVYASSGLTLELDAAGNLVSVEVTVQEVSYKSSKVVGYHADCCGETLPDWYQDRLDRELEIRRKD